jgi:hypothetical protein
MPGNVVFGSVCARRQLAGGLQPPGRTGGRKAVIQMLDEGVISRPGRWGTEA